MPSKYRLRYIFRPLIQILARALVKIKVNANMATGMMLFCSIISFIFLVFFRNLLIFSIFVFLTGIFDGLDGAIARLNNKTDGFGSFLDSFMDRISEFIIFLALLIYFWDRILWKIIDMRLIIFISLVSSMMISYSRGRAETIIDADFDIGLMARSERLFYIFITMIISFFIGYEEHFIFIFMLLVVITALYRGIKIYYIIKKEKPN
ncbi:MAG: CDP-alcohol phosphatidyltransferase family protein [Promethearchaeati archaeon]